MILLPTITLAFILLSYSHKNRRRFDIVHLLLLTYLVMGCAGLVLELSGLFTSVIPIAFEPMAYLSLCFIIVFWGFTGFRTQTFALIRIDHSSLYRALETFLLIGGFLGIIFFFPFAIGALTGDIASNRLAVATVQEHLGRFGIANSIFSLLSNLFIVAQVCAFINLISRDGRRNPKKAYMLLTSSFSYVVYILAYVGRDGVVYWLLSYLFCFLLFRDFVARDDLKRLNRYVALSATIFIFVFILISIARFSASNVGTGWEIVRYTGQQVRNFNDHYIVAPPLQYGKFCFPALYDLTNLLGLDVGPKLDMPELHAYFLDQGVQPWVFTTYIGLLMLDVGKVGLLVFLALMSLITRSILRKVARTGSFGFSDLVLFVLLYQIVFWGVFYFRQYSANYYMLFMLLLAVLFKTRKVTRGAVYLSKAADATQYSLRGIVAAPKRRRPLSRSSPTSWP